MFTLIDVLNSDLTALRNEKLRRVEVAVIDSGIDARHEILKNTIREAWGFRKDPEGAIEKLPLAPGDNDLAGHGTAVASIIHRIAPNARISDYRVLNDGMSGTGDVMLAGMKAAIESDAKIINMSLACLRKYRDGLSELCEMAYRRHKIVIASKRNMPQPNDLGFPAEYSSCISVDNRDYDTPFFVEYIDRKPIEFAAHGERVMVAKNGGGYYRLTGTSFATPTVSGIVALLLGKFPSLEPFEIKSFLKHHSRLGTFRKPRVTNPMEIADPRRMTPPPEGGMACVCDNCSAVSVVPEAFLNVRCPVCGEIFPVTSMLDRKLCNEVLRDLQINLPPGHVYHNRNHALEVIAGVRYAFAHYPRLSRRIKKCLLTAALFHDCGYKVSYLDNEAAAAESAGEILPRYGYTPSEIALIKSLIMATAWPVSPKNLPEKIICDADLWHIGTPLYFERSRRLRREQDRLDREKSDEEWLAAEIAFLSGHRFHQRWLEIERRETRARDLEKLRRMAGRKKV